MNFRNLKISRKLAVSFALVIAVFVGVSFYLRGQFDQMNEEAMSASNSYVVSQHAREMMLAVIEQQNAIRGFSALGKEEFVETYQKNKVALREAADAFLAGSKVDLQKQRVQEFMRLADKWQTERLDVIVKLARNPATRQEAQEMAGVKQLGDFRRIMADIEKDQDARIASKLEVVDEAYASANFALLSGGILAVAAAGVLGWLLSVMIAKPVSGMTAAMKRLADGDNRIEVPGTGRKDEIGAMAEAVLVFRDAAIEKERLDAAKRAADAAQKLVVDTLADNLGKVATGDLTAQITADFPADYASVKTNFNEALASLRSLIGSVTESAAAIRTGSGEIAQASEDLARRTEGNAASLEETSAALVQIDGRLKASATAAGRTVERADQAIAIVGEGRATADEAVQAMGRVNESAKGIDSVIEGLDKIAFQTRVLAMNAAVEAGRAGDAGRGFAVVADLVSALAMRSEEEAKRARDQLTATQGDIVAAVEAVQRVDGALANISGSVADVHQLLNTMAADNQAQSAAISQISTAIGSMDQATQQNAAMVEETSAAARNLTSEVGELSAQAAKFTVAAEMPRSTARPPARPAKPQPIVAKPYLSPVKPLPTAALANGHANGHAHDDWKDF